jgi:hypothetical protein
VRTGVEATGDVSIEMSYGSYDDLLEGALRSSWNTLVSPTDDISATNSTSYTRTSGSFVTDGFQVGQWVYWTGFSQSENNGWHKVTAVAATTLTVAQTTATDGPTSVTAYGDFLSNGVEKHSYLLEKKLPTTSGTEYISFRGMRVGSMALDIAPGSIMTGSFSFMGDRGYPAAATAGDGSPNAASTTKVLNAIDNVAEIQEGGSAFSGTVTSINMNLNGALRGLPAVAVLGNSQIGIGTIEVTGTMEVYFEDRTTYEKYTNYTLTSLSFELSDASNNYYLIDMPAMYYTDGQVQVPGKDGDVVASLNFTAFRDATDLFTIGITRAGNVT